MAKNTLLDPIQQQYYNRLLDWLIKPFIAILLMIFCLLVISLGTVTFAGTLIGLGFLGLLILSLFVLAGFIFVKYWHSKWGRVVVFTLIAAASGLVIYSIRNRVFDGLGTVPSPQGVWGFISGFSLGIQVAIIEITLNIFARRKRKSAQKYFKVASVNIGKSIFLGLVLSLFVGVPIANSIVPGIGLLFALLTGMFAWFSFGGSEILENYALRRALVHTSSSSSHDRKSS